MLGGSFESRVNRTLLEHPGTALAAAFAHAFARDGGPCAFAPHGHGCRFSRAATRDAPLPPAAQLLAAPADALGTSYERYWASGFCGNGRYIRTAAGGLDTLLARLACLLGRHTLVVRNLTAWRQPGACFTLASQWASQSGSPTVLSRGVGCLCVCP